MVKSGQFRKKITTTQWAWVFFIHYLFSGKVHQILSLTYYLLLLYNFIIYCYLLRLSVHNEQANILLLQPTVNYVLVHAFNAKTFGQNYCSLFTVQFNQKTEKQYWKNY